MLAVVTFREIECWQILELVFNWRLIEFQNTLLVRVASTAIATDLLQGDRDTIVNALSNAWIDGGALRTYRHAPNTGTRKSWAAGDATSRGVRIALMAISGEMGYPSALTASQWGFSDVLMDGKEVILTRPLGSYVMENILFKISYPAEFHAQTAVEAAIRLYPKVSTRLDDIAEIIVETQEPAIRIIDKTGPLHNPADRDHCLQYMVAVSLIYGHLAANNYQEEFAKDPRIDELRAKMTIRENSSFTRDYYDSEKRFIGNAIQVFFLDGSCSERVCVDVPIGHRRRRDEGLPLIIDKFKLSVKSKLAPAQYGELEQRLLDLDLLRETPFEYFMSLLTT